MDKNNKSKKVWYKRVWVWVAIVVVIGLAGSAAGGNSGTSPATTAPSTNTGATTPATPKEEAKLAKWDYEAAYAKITNGMTKAQVEEATGKGSESCTESEIAHIGKTETCTYGNAFIDKASIFVVYSNGEVSSKTKSTY
jgi:hypothetical protein